MTNTVLDDIYSYFPKGATKTKQLAPVFLQGHLSNQYDLCT